MSEFWKTFADQAGKRLNRYALLDPFINTDEEKLQAKQLKLANMQVDADTKNFEKKNELVQGQTQDAIEQIDANKKKRLFELASLPRKEEAQKLSIEAQKMSLEAQKRNNMLADYRAKNDIINTHIKTAQKNVYKGFEAITGNMTDADRAELWGSKEAKNQVDFSTFGRLAVKALQSKTPEEKKYNMDLVNQYAGEHGYSITEKDGQYYLSGENMPKVVLNKQNFAQINNAIAKAFADEIKLRAKLISDKNTVYGGGRLDAVKRINAVAGEDDKNSWSRASKIFAEIGKNMTRGDVNVYSLRRNINKFLEDDTLDDNERQALLQNMAILADATGTKYELGTDGNPLVIKEDGSRVNLKQFAKELKFKDKLGNWLDEYEGRMGARQIAVQQIKKLDKGGVLNSSAYTNQEKKDYEKLLKKVEALRASGNDIFSIKKMWDGKIKDMGISIEDAPFPYAEDYYPQAESSTYKKLRELDRKAGMMNNFGAKEIGTIRDADTIFSRIFGYEDPREQNQKKSDMIISKSDRYRRLIKERNEVSRKLQRIRSENPKNKKG